MAIPAWLSVSPTSGTGNGSVTAIALSANTGRSDRSYTLKFSATGVQNVPDVVCPVAQEGKAEFVTIQSSKSVSKSGGSITITGTSNSSKLTFSLGTGSLSLTLPSTYTANSTTTNNGAAISGDPGNTAEYSFSITISNIPANATVSQISKQVIVTTNNGQTATCTVTQAAGDATLSISPTSVSLGWESGSSATVSVTSNTTWEIPTT